MNGLVLEELVRTVSGYGIDDVPSVTLSDEQSTLLKDQDSSQAELMAEKVILVDENDNIIGSDSKIDTHHDVGKLHRAFSVLLFNSEGKLLLQRRALGQSDFSWCLGKYLLLSSSSKRGRDESE